MKFVGVGILLPTPTVVYFWNQTMNLYKFHTKPESLPHYQDYKKYHPNILTGIPKKPSVKQLTLMKRNLLLAYRYAFYDLRGRWPEAEPYIMKDPFYAFGYARNVIKGRWPEAEPYIMKDPEFALNYSVMVIKGRWPEAEPYIMKDPEQAFEYAVHILQNRWPEAEPYIMKNPHYAFLYARDILRKRWPEAEPIIKTDELSWMMYETYLKPDKTL